MAGPWEDYAGPQANPQEDAPPWAAYQTGPLQDLPMQPWKASVLPVSTDSEGKPHFDPTAGLLGALTNAVTLPGDVYTGKVQLPSGPPQEPIPGQPTSTEPGLLSTFGLNPKPIYSDSGPGFGRAMGMAMSVIPDAAPVGGLLRSATAKDVQPPSTRALYDAANQGYDAARNMGVDYSSPAVASLADNVQRGLEAKGFFREQAPQTHALLDKLQAVPDQPSVVSISSLDSARKGFGNTAGAGGSEGAAAGIAKDAIDGFVSRADPAGVVSGPAPEAAQTFADARANYAAASRSRELTNLASAADNRAAAANSGQNIDNAIRSRVATLLDPNHPERIAGFNQDEIAALNDVMRGTAPRNTLRYVGNLLGGGGGLGALVTGGISGAAGSAVAGPFGILAGTVPPAVGLLAKKAANSLTEGALNRADELVRQRSPVFQGLLAGAPPVARRTMPYQTIMRGLLDPYATNSNY